MASDAPAETGLRGRLAGVKRLVVKVGSAVLTDPQGLDQSAIEHLVEQMAKLHAQGKEVILVTSGAVAAGRGLFRSAVGAECLVSKQALSAVGQSRLMHTYDEAFGRRSLVTAQILLTKDDVKDRQRFLNARNTLATLLSWRVIPIINENDTVAVDELRFGDNDTLAALILNLVEAELFINLTSEQGVFSSNPREDPGAEFLEEIDRIEFLDLPVMCSGKTVQGSGGMYSKLLAAKRAAQLGVPTLIAPGREKDILLRGISGEACGTLIHATPRAVSRRKYWFAYNLDPAGTLYVDRGAARALRSGGKSLLPIGITNVEGVFGVGDLVRIVDQEGVHIGAGLSNYKAIDVRRIMGKKGHEAMALLDRAGHVEVIHRDNLLLDAVVT